ncbi:hypothetical protein HMPREF9057_03040 [Actinomyces sp. oral taxon 171 str. F0337]|nr:hypothetical protein HMPREF9057_03040 [Actinomyces sp. oral taxon 171 str. F0337]
MLRRDMRCTSPQGNLIRVYMEGGSDGRGLWATRFLETPG